LAPAVHDHHGIRRRLEKVAELVFFSFSMCDVAVALKDGGRLAIQASAQHPAAGNDYFRAIAPLVNQLALPRAAVEQFRVDVSQGFWKNGLEERVSNFAACFFLAPPIEPLGAKIPVENFVFEVPNKD